MVANVFRTAVASQSLLSFFSRNSVTAGRLRWFKSSCTLFQEQSQIQTDAEGSYAQYLSSLSFDTLVENRSSMLLYKRGKRAVADKWIECWKDIAQKLFPAQYGFRVTEESLTLPDDDAVFQFLFSWPVNYLAIRKDTQCQEFGIFCAHDPGRYVSETERFRQALHVSSKLGNVLRHVGRAGHRTYWVHTFGHEFICAENHHRCVLKPLHEHIESIWNPASIGILRTVAQKIASWKGEKLFKEIPTEISGVYTRVSVN